MPPVNRNKPKRSRASESSYSLIEFMNEWPDDETCLDYLWRERFSPDGKTADCPKCGKPRPFHRIYSRPSYSCDYCGHHIHPLAGTIFEKSSTSLHLWFHAIFLMSQTRCGVSAKHLERTLGVTYKTAWRMFHLIRKQLMTEDDDKRLGGTVELDELYVGGKGRSRSIGRAYRKGSKTPVLGIVQRKGQVRAYVLHAAKGEYILPHVRRVVAAGSSVYTDENLVYGPLGWRGEYIHKSIPHTARIYARGDVHTNTVEALFWLIKTGIRGTYHHVSAKHLQGYVNEWVFRWNHQNDPVPMFRTLLLRAALR
jgi:transposase-like protein